MKMAALAITRRNALLYDTELGSIDEVPPLARRAPLIAFARCEIDNAKHDASETP